MQHPTGVASMPHDVSRDDGASREERKQGAVAGNVYLNEPSHGAQMQLPSGSLPPQQVYVSSGMPGMPGMPSVPGSAIAGLENQFQSLGFKQEDSIGTDQLSSSGPNSESNNPDEAEIEGEESEDDPIKLFVGQVCQTHVTLFQVISEKI